MDGVCKFLRLDLEYSSACVLWYKEATDYCAHTMTQPRGQHSNFWTKLQQIFAKPPCDLLSMQLFMYIHPSRLSLSDCHELLQSILDDYRVVAARQSTGDTINSLLMHVLFSLLTVFTLGALIVVAAVVYKRFDKVLQLYKPMDELFTWERQNTAVSKRSMRRALHELRRLRVAHIVQPEELFAPDGTKTLVIKMTSLLDFVDGVVTSNFALKGTIYRMYDGSKKQEYKTKTVADALKFFSTCTRKVRVLVVFEDEVVEKRKAAKCVALPAPPAAARPSRRLTPRGYAVQSASSPCSSLGSSPRRAHLNSARSVRSDTPPNRQTNTTTITKGFTKIPRHSFYARN